VIGVPPSKGAVQVKLTFVLDIILVTGTTGVNGLEAAMMLTDDEYPPKPTKLRAFTMYE
jgi:hypothetical protein